MAQNEGELEQFATGFMMNGFAEQRHYHHHHVFKPKQPSQLATVDHDVDGLHQQLLRSISLILDAIGFDGAHPDALESLALHVQAFMSHFLSYAKASMSSSRRSQLSPQDFEFALTSHHYTFRCLLPHLDPPVAQDLRCLPILADAVAHNGNELLMERFHATLNDYTQPRLPYAPRGLPLLPSHHTYKATQSFIPRERDPKRIRELATEEARMGEEALRRLVAGTGQSRTKETDGKLSSRQKQKKLWHETMEAMAADAIGSKEMLDETTLNVDLAGAPVNADHVYWRKPVRSHA